MTSIGSSLVKLQFHKKKRQFSWRHLKVKHLTVGIWKQKSYDIWKYDIGNTFKQTEQGNIRRWDIWKDDIWTEDNWKEDIKPLN